MTRRILCLVGCIHLLSFQHTLPAQSDITEALGQVESQGCLSGEQRVKLSGWLADLSAPEAGQALKLAAGCYLCLLQKKAAPEAYESFREVLKDRLYSRVPSERLCLQDRLIRSLIDLRRITGGQAVDMSSLDSALNDFLGAYSACGNVHRNPGLPTSTRLARDWCLDPKKPWPPYELTREFIDNIVLIASMEPDQGRHLGSVLAVILREEMAFDSDARKMHEAADAWRVLIEPDRGNLAGTSQWFLFQKKLTEIVPLPDWAEPAQIHALLLASKDLQTRLEKFAERLQYRGNAWKPFEEYSELLYDLGNRIRSSYSERDSRDRLVRQACRFLQRGIEVSDESGLPGLAQSREKLLDRVRSFGLELGRTGKYRDVILFESKFIDPSFRTLTADQQCYLHAHMAQAHYALGEYREAMDEFGKSCGKITLQDLTGTW